MTATLEALPGSDFLATDADFFRQAWPRVLAQIPIVSLDPAAAGTIIKELEDEHGYVNALGSRRDRFMPRLLCDHVMLQKGYDILLFDENDEYPFYASYVDAPDYYGAVLPFQFSDAINRRTDNASANSWFGLLEAIGSFAFGDNNYRGEWDGDHYLIPLALAAEEAVDLYLPLLDRAEALTICTRALMTHIAVKDSLYADAYEEYPDHDEFHADEECWSFVRPVIKQEYNDLRIRTGLLPLGAEEMYGIAYRVVTEAIRSGAITPPRKS